jgi:hypothetical protein
MPLSVATALTAVVLIVLLTIGYAAAEKGEPPYGEPAAVQGQ